jgi:competence protein ComFC
MRQELKKFILDTLFPVQCLLCKQDDFWVCPKCLGKIKMLPAQVCPYCEKINIPGGKICPDCKEKFLAKNQVVPVDNLIVAVKYNETGISHIIHLFKYRFVSDLSRPFGKLLVKSLIENNSPVPDLIIPVPLHKRRLRWRGFNQSELLADYISQNLTPGFSIPVASDLIYRKRYTTAQMKIKNYEERKKNIKNAFGTRENMVYNLNNKNILLIDDIATTGSTFFECGRVLKAAGAGKIYSCVIARQEWKSVL